MILRNSRKMDTEINMPKRNYAYFALLSVMRSPTLHKHVYSYYNVKLGG